jgi:hypothetical protein
LRAFAPCCVDQLNSQPNSGHKAKDPDRSGPFIRLQLAWPLRHDLRGLIHHRHRERCEQGGGGDQAVEFRHLGLSLRITVIR